VMVSVHTRLCSQDTRAPPKNVPRDPSHTSYVPAPTAQTSDTTPPSILDYIGSLIPDWVSTRWGWALLMGVLAAIFGCSVNFLQYSSGRLLYERLRWLTPKSLRKTVRNSTMWKDPLCTDVMWSLRSFSRVDRFLHDPLVQISLLSSDTIAFGTEAEYKASCSNTSKRHIYSVGVGIIQLSDFGEYIQLQVDVDTPNPDVTSEIQWFFNNKALVDQASTIIGTTTRVLVLESQNLSLGSYKVEVTTPGYVTDVRSVTVWRGKDGKIFISRP